MKIFSAKQIKELDKLTCHVQNITPLDLMERAAQKCVAFLDKEVKASHYVVFAGMGDNGGDGFAIARMLFMAGTDVSVVVIKHRSAFSASAEVNFNRIKAIGVPVLLVDQHISLHKVFESVKSESVIIDAIFGIGFNGLLPHWIESITKSLSSDNLSAQMVVSIDAPSGLRFTHDFSERNTALVECEILLTFQAPKLTLFFPEYANAFQRMVVLDIGLEIDTYQLLMHLKDGLEEFCYFDQLPPLKMRARTAHKGSCGHALVVGGSCGKIGAAVLTTRATIASGAGLVTAYTPQCGGQIMTISIPDAMVICDEGGHAIAKIDLDLSPYSAIAVGPGLGTSAATEKAFVQLLRACHTQKKALVIDADGLNILASNSDLLNLLPPGTILTPHLKELERLIGVSTKDSHLTRLALTREFCMRYQLNVIVKGCFSVVVTQDGLLYFNSSGNQGLATAGSGDVLTGVVAGLLASHPTTPIEVSIWACYLHGLAADIMVDKIGYESVTASGVIENLGFAFKQSQGLR